MKESERSGRMTLVGSDPEGPLILWEEAAPVTARGRVHLSADGRIAFTEVTVVGREGAPVGSDEIRMVPITSMLTAANGVFRDGILRVLAVRGDDAAQALLEARPRVKAKAAPKRRPVMRFDVPEGAKPDSFYASIASAYRWLVTEEGSRRPARDLADANGVPSTTAHRWIREARRRGILGPGVRGRAGL